MVYTYIQTRGEKITVIFFFLTPLLEAPKHELEFPLNKTIIKSSTYDLQSRCQVPCDTYLHT